MVLFDWAAERRKRWFEEGRQEGRQEARQEWQAWAQRLLEAKERGEDFDEPPPSAKNGADPKLPPPPPQLNAKTRRIRKDAKKTQ